MSKTTQSPYRTRIREIRKLRGLTLEEVARDTGTTPQTIQRLETDQMTVSLDWLERLAGALEVKPVDLLGARSHEGPADETAEFFAATGNALIRNRRQVEASEDTFPALVECMGQMAATLTEHRAGLRPWSDVETAASAVAAGAMRIALDGRRSGDVVPQPPKLASVA